MCWMFEWSDRSRWLGFSFRSPPSFFCLRCVPIFRGQRSMIFSPYFASALKKSKDGRRMRSEDACLSPGVPQSCCLQKCIAGGMVRANFEYSRQPKNKPHSAVHCYPATVDPPIPQTTKGVPTSNKRCRPCFQQFWKSADLASTEEEGQRGQINEIGLSLPMRLHCWLVKPNVWSYSL